MSTTPVPTQRFPRFSDYRVADLSTACLSDDDRFLLMETTEGMTVIAYGEGWLIYCGDLAVKPDQITAIREAGFSEDFIELLCEGNRQGFRYLNFDQDGADDWN